MGVELGGKHNGKWDCAALSGCRSAIGQFGAKICAPIRRSLHVVTISWSVMRRKCRFSKNGPKSGVFFLQTLAYLETLVSLRNRTAKCSCVINLAGLLLMCFVVIFILKESEVWRKVISKQNYCYACLTRFAVFLPLPSCCVSSLLRYEDGDGR